MKTLKEYILEHLSPIHIYESHFSDKDWFHHGMYDYAKAVVQSLLDGKELLLGEHGEGKGDITHVDKNDFDVEALGVINSKLDKVINGTSTENPPTVEDFKNAFKNKKMKNIWTSLFKGDFSGNRGKGGVEFEHKLAANIQTLILNSKLPDGTPYKEVSEKLFNKIKDTDTIKTLLEMRENSELDEKTIGSYVFVSGKGKTARNKYNQIINTNTFEVNVSKKNTLTHETEDEIENVLTQSGKIIADVTITLDGDKFNKSDIKHVNKDDIYISCKDGASQFSGISMQQPFYGDSQKTNNNSYIVKCYKNNVSYDDFISGKALTPITEDDKICINAYKNLCNFMGVNGKIVYDYFKQPKNERPEKQPLNIAKSDEENDEIIATLIQLLIGGNYWYVNSSGDVVYIDDDIDGNKFTFIPSKNGQLDSSQIKISGIIRTNDGDTKCDLKFRNGDKEDYPFRLFIYPDKHILSKLFLQNNENS